MRCISERTMKDGVTFPCGKCGPCLSRRRSEWSFRLEKEEQSSLSSFFVTLTYDDLHCPRDGVSSDHCRDFLKRLRKRLSPIRLRFYLVSEYGSKTFRPHYHALFFLDTFVTLSEITNTVYQAWNQGLIHVGSCSPASIRYTTKYMISRSVVPPGMNKPFTRMSNRPGIGFSFLERTSESYLEYPRLFARKNGNVKVSLPRYYRTKLYTSDEIRSLTSDFYSPERHFKQLYHDFHSSGYRNTSSDFLDWQRYCLERSEENSKKIISDATKNDKI